MPDEPWEKGGKANLFYKKQPAKAHQGGENDIQRRKLRRGRKKENKDKLTVLTVTLKGVAAVDVGSMDGVLLSEDPGILRRRPVLSGGDSEQREDLTFGLRIVKTSIQ